MPAKTYARGLGTGTGWPAGTATAWRPSALAAATERMPMGSRRRERQTRNVGDRERLDGSCVGSDSPSGGSAAWRPKMTPTSSPFLRLTANPRRPEVAGRGREARPSIPAARNEASANVENDRVDDTAGSPCGRTPRLRSRAEGTTPKLRPWRVQGGADARRVLGRAPSRRSPSASVAPGCAPARDSATNEATKLDLMPIHVLVI